MIIRGADSYWDLVTGETQKLDIGLRAINTVFGWTIHGCYCSNNIKSENLLCSLIEVTADPKVGFERFWSMELLGLDTEKRQSSEEIIVDNHNHLLNFEKN